MKRIIPSLLLLLGPALAAQKPNILWVITDDQRLDSISAFNRMTRDRDDSPLGKVLSPNVDRLAAMGTTFINSYNQNPSCAPSRTIMHSGRYSHRTGVYGFEYYYPTSELEHWRPMIPEVMAADAGYQTVSVGKGGLYYRQPATTPKGKPQDSNIYQVNLGYRREYAPKGLYDWDKQTDWKSTPKQVFEVFQFSDGEKLSWPVTKGATPDDRPEIRDRLDILRAYSAGDDEHTGMVIGGVNPQSGDKTRDGWFLTELSQYLDNCDQPHTTVYGSKLQGPKSAAPLFVHLGFEAPHTPVLPPQEFRDKFKGITYEIPEFTKEELAGFPPQIQKLYSHSASDHYTTAEKQQMVSDYFAYCAYVDDLVGKAVDKFIGYSEKNQQPWMVLYVCGDHGWRLNEHGMISKFGPFDTDLQNPIIVASSDKTRFPADKVVTDFTTFLDMAPTFYAAAGIDLNQPSYAYLDGEDLAKVAGGALPPRDYIIAEPTHVIGPRAVIRTKEYKFSMRIRPGRIDGKKIDWAIKAPLEEVEPMFFDLRSDPEEIHNLASESHYRPVIDVLRKKLQDIVLGDGRVECKWDAKGDTTVVTSNFAPGADDGKISLPGITPLAR
ncbi:sulfatase-like hydrolase/transferase [Luteolibacter algae]|uniref:Sulfatase-like hydrolase/transferase n=1 Tax=Luteolibacter algae TaxID=454151 RepID=A0ABW5D658_9BACT